MAKPAGAGNPFTNPDANARLHANANAAFMRATRPGNQGDAGGLDTNIHQFTHTGELHRHDANHPDTTLIPGGDVGGPDAGPLPVTPRGRNRPSIL